MIFHLLLCFWLFVVDLVRVRRLGDREKEFELVLLRQQLRIVERRQRRGPVLARWEKVPLVALTARLRAGAAIGDNAAIQARYSAQMASPARAWQVNLQAVQQGWPSTDRSGDRGLECAAGEREPALGQ